MNRSQRLGGFTLIELLVTLALLGVAASAVLPLASIVAERAREAELRSALITIRTALDNYKAAADSGAIDKPTGSSGYPPNLDVLATGVRRANAPGPDATPLVFLRRVPRDPFFSDASTPASRTWLVRSYGAKPGDFRPGPDVFDVTSTSTRRALDGTRHSDW